MAKITIVYVSIYLNSVTASGFDLPVGRGWQTLKWKFDNFLAPMASYSLDEVRKHNTKENLWVIHNQKVYDLTDFCKRHPGGARVLLTYGGQDVTSDMNTTVSPDTESKHVHSKFAYNILNKYYIGELSQASKVSISVSKPCRFQYIQCMSVIDIHNTLSVSELSNAKCH